MNIIKNLIFSVFLLAMASQNILQAMDNEEYNNKKQAIEDLKTKLQNSRFTNNQQTQIIQIIENENKSISFALEDASSVTTILKDKLSFQNAFKTIFGYSYTTCKDGLKNFWPNLSANPSEIRDTTNNKNVAEALKDIEVQKHISAGYNIILQEKDILSNSTNWPPVEITSHDKGDYILSLDKIASTMDPTFIRFCICNALAQLDRNSDGRNCAKLLFTKLANTIPATVSATALAFIVSVVSTSGQSESNFTTHALASIATGGITWLAGMIYANKYKTEIENEEKNACINQVAKNLERRSEIEKFSNSRRELLNKWEIKTQEKNSDTQKPVGVIRGYGIIKKPNSTSNPDSPLYKSSPIILQAEE